VGVWNEVGNVDEEALSKEGVRNIGVGLSEQLQTQLMKKMRVM